MQKKCLSFALLLLMFGSSALAEQKKKDFCGECEKSCPTTECCPKPDCDDVTGHTYFAIKPHAMVADHKVVSASRDRMIAREDGINGFFQVIGFGGKSRKGCELGTYFSFCSNKTGIVAEGPRHDDSFPGLNSAQGSDAWQQDQYDALARNFDIVTVNGDFQSEIRLNPEQAFGGVVFDWKQGISTEDDRGWWFRVLLPVIHVRNDLRFTESVINDGGGAAEGHVGNMVSALDNPAWDCCRIRQCRLDDTQVAELELMIGYDKYREDTCTYGGYVGVVVPTSERPHSQVMFEPITGNGNHFGIMCGWSAQFEMWSDEDSRFLVAYDHNARYLIRRTQTRCIDLCNKPGSRFMPIYLDENATTTQPGVNFFSTDVRVSPRTSNQMNTAFIFEHKGFRAELGYNVFCRQSEKVCLPDKDCEGTNGFREGIALAGTEQGRSQNCATIRDWNNGKIIDDLNRADASTLNQLANATADDVDLSVLEYKFKGLTRDDLDLRTAAHPSTVAHAVYGSLAYNWDDIEFPVFVAAGGSYEFSADNTSMHRWNAWGKLGVSV